ncbi:hypothetical protein SAMN05216532_0131 [Streptomyces sp. 2231.1]|uniref:hypothetical protein n=1 Tax=Streptomyces sp. 2231.1 TaxID=1855347 RepID=UPI00089BD5E8|nr:hypothetical protein [Streptomyces sp. 2231.1]SEB99258.1 hypothetical protein SAMN05216532_0131 [Streptomyces sp. 2231.1]
MTVTQIPKKRVQVKLSKITATNTEDYYAGATDEIALTCWAHKNQYPVTDLALNLTDCVVRRDIYQGQTVLLAPSEGVVLDAVVPANTVLAVSAKLMDLDYEGYDVTPDILKKANAKIRELTTSKLATAASSKDPTGSLPVAMSLLKVIGTTLQSYPQVVSDLIRLADPPDELGTIRQMLDVSKLQSGSYAWRVTDAPGANVVDSGAPESVPRNVSARNSLLYGYSNYDYTIWYDVKVANV